MKRGGTHILLSQEMEWQIPGDPAVHMCSDMSNFLQPYGL